MITIGSLFSGIGGLDLGLESALAEASIPARVAWQVEREEFPRRVLAKHWPHADRSVTDVCNAGLATIPRVDLICGGFPCQDLSYAGKGAGLAGARSGLWSEYVRIVRELLPRVVVVENVSALLARGIGAVLGDLAEAGYDAEWRCIRASDVGAPHRRERVFIVAHSQRLRELQPEGREPHERRRASDGGRDVGDPDVSRLEGRSEPERGGGDERIARQAGTAGFDHDGGRGPQSGVGRVADGLSGRLVLSARWPAAPGQAQEEWEALRVAQGVKGRADALKAYGNAVVPHVAREVGRWIIREGWLMAPT